MKIRKKGSVGFKLLSISNSEQTITIQPTIKSKDGKDFIKWEAKVLSVGDTLEIDGIFILSFSLN